MFKTYCPTTKLPDMSKYAQIYTAGEISGQSDLRSRAKRAIWPEVRLTQKQRHFGATLTFTNLTSTDLISD